MAQDIITCIKSFITVHKYGSFTAAARELYIANSVLTKQIKHLELYLGKELFSRTTRSLTLTDAGRLFLNSANKIINELGIASATINNIDQEPTGIINLALPGALQGGDFINIIANFLKKYPKIHINTTNHTSPSQLLDKSTDVIISEFNLHDKQFIKESLLSYTRGIFASPEYLQKNGIPRQIEDLQKHNCIIYKLSSPTDEWIFANNKKIKVSGNYSASAGIGTTAAGVAGIGLIWIPHSMVKNEINSGRLVEVKLDTEALTVETYLYYLPTNNNGINKLLLDHLKTSVVNIAI